MPSPIFVQVRNATVSEDTAEAIRQLELKLAGSPYRLEVRGNQLSGWEGDDLGPTGLPPHLSLRNSGRELHLQLHPTDSSGTNPLTRLWEEAVPLGWLPWNRFPLPGPLSGVFHYLGPLAPIGDHLQGEGRGDLAWPSMACAGQILAGTWGGGQLLERSVQTQLHLLGVPCGAIDGVIGESTLSAIRALGLGGRPLDWVLQKLELMRPLPREGRQEVQNGFLSFPGEVEAFTSGQVYVTRTPVGYSITTEGSGRLILAFRRSK